MRYIYKIKVLGTGKKGYCDACHCNKNNIISIRYYWIGKYSFRCYKEKQNICMDCITKRKNILFGDLSGCVYLHSTDSVVLKSEIDAINRNKVKQGGQHGKD